ncbi:MAG: ornithine carbamoyltransferase [Chloroflexi bacterium]|nr:ornithine carbamoyltransferase [Chloroflexota bacterium]
MPSLTAPVPPASAAPLRSFLTLDQLGPHGLRALLDLTARLKRDPEPFRNSLAGGRLGMLFDKPSTRTRVSFESAAWTLGMLPIVLRPDELQIGRGETISDTGHTLSLYLNAIAVRTFSQASLEELAAASSIPVINALTNEHHPCQAVADVMTLEETFGTLAGISVAFIGDGDNVCHSLMQAAALAGFELRVATPPGYEPDPGITAAAREAGRATGGTILLTNDPVEAVSGVQAVYTDVWTSMGKEAEQATRKATFAGFTVDAPLMRHASTRAIFLHCLPAHRGEEVAAEVIDGPASRVWPQAENRMHTEAALLYTIVAGDPGGERLP